MYAMLLIIIYFAFISLGLPDSLLGAAWPQMYLDFSVPISYAGIVSLLIAFGTVISALLSDRLTKKFGAGMVTAISTAITALMMIGFSFAPSFWVLIIFAIPYGLGAGSIDAALNNYVALHYASRHMSWLHAMWGVGTLVGPFVMGKVLTANLGWGLGYRIIGYIQIVLTIALFISLPLWKHIATSNHKEEIKEEAREPIPLRKVIKIKGAKSVMITFFCYCALEASAMLWSASYMVLHAGMDPAKAATFASMFFIGITVGRIINGFLTLKWSDDVLIRFGQGIIAIGCLILIFANTMVTVPIGFILMGLGCAPIYPSIIHSTPAHFGADKSQSIVGIEMASAYIGTSLMPPLFGLIANHVDVMWLPYFILFFLIATIFGHEILVKKTKTVSA